MLMQALLVNPREGKRLSELQGLTELLDADGNVLGFYMPTPFRRDIATNGPVEMLGDHGSAKLSWWGQGVHPQSDADAPSALAMATRLTAVCDALGSVVGYFMPLSDSAEKAKLYAQAAARIDPQELARRKKYRGPGRTTQEILDRLQTLPRS